jgi:hypothetical protein
MSSSQKPPAFQSSLCRRIVKLSYLIGSISIVITAALFTTYLFAYPFRSNVCNGIDNSADDAAALCLSQQVDRGYIATSTLVKGTLLPAGFAKLTNQAAIDADPTVDGDYVLCEWNAEVTRCEEAEPDQAGCDSELNDDGTRKHRFGTDSECDALKVPELCKQTGFKSASTVTAQEDLATAGANAEISAAILFITMCLGIASFFNYYWQPITSICQSEMLSGLCSHYGKPFKLDIAYIVCGMWSSESCKHCAKKGQTGGDIGGEPAKFETDYEAATIWFSFLVHNVLILIFGLIGTSAKAAVDDECYGVKNADGELDIYGTGDAQEYIDALVDKDAKTYLDQRGSIYTVAQIFWWINLIAAGIQTGSYIMSNSGTSDMDLVAVRDISDLNPFADIGVDSRGKYSQLATSEEGGEKNELYSRRTVQLRGQF